MLKQVTIQGSCVTAVLVGDASVLHKFCGRSRASGEIWSSEAGYHLLRAVTLEVVGRCAQSSFVCPWLCVTSSALRVRTFRCAPSSLVF
eukprot:4734165-Pleurochrysis_carterae.AAC.1